MRADGMENDVVVVQSSSSMSEKKKTWNDRCTSMAGVSVPKRTETERLSGKSAQSITNTQKHVSLKIWTNISVHQKYSLEWIKTHLLNLPQSANTVVKMTGFPDFTHLIQPVCERATTCCVCTSGSKTKLCLSHARGYIKTNKQKNQLNGKVSCWVRYELPGLVSPACSFPGFVTEVVAA